jgi:predicted CxxxxCH...CXXCH cytochrome family protein
MRSNHLLTLAALVSLVALIGCDKARPLPAPADTTRRCLSCHGGEENSTGAPPFSLPRDADGNIVASGTRYTRADNTTQIEVGAHTRHIARGVSCGACHVVPAMITSPGHNTGKRAIVTFKELAAAGNVIPSAWVPAVHTCTNYCHGSSLGHGGTNHAPDWLGGAPAGACGTCHFGAGVTPPAQHPQGPGGAGFADTRACAACHTETVNAADGTINVTGGKHVNGQLDGGGGHSPGWADPANHGPAASGGLQGCTVCHGTDFNGGSTGVSCNACHSANGHPNWQTECTFCHGSTTRAADATFPNVGTGTVVRANLAAPPVGSQGENAITAYAVGAHDAHLTIGAFARAAQCLDCHGPSLPADTTHVNGTVVVGWGATASNGIVPTPAAGNLARWNDATLPANGANCTNFCHGATLAGGTHPSPKWNEGATGATCGSCHAIPLPYTAAGGWHVQRTDCNTCHPGYTNSSVSVTDHVFVGAGPQGLTCTSCHGSSLSNAAPPNDINGGTDPNRVGAHQKHVATLTLHQGGFTCTECHADNAGNTRHANGSVNILWGTTAAAGGGAVAPASGGYTPGAVFPSCTNYCHLPRANDTAAGLVKAPLWTATGNIVCGSCHGLPPLTPTHPTGATACSSCHDGYGDAPTAASSATAVSLTNHINGVIDVKSLSCTGCHGTAGRTSVAGADPLQPVAPPVAVTSVAAVGAHQAHVNQGDTAAPGVLSRPLACINCHNGLIPVAAPHAYPANPVAFGNLALVAGATPNAYVQATQTCSSTYCHGSFLGGNGANPITWGAAGKLTCTSCHGAPPTATDPSHPANPGTCGDCHPGYTNTTVNVALHVNGQLDGGGESGGGSQCSGCHASIVTLMTSATSKHSLVGWADTFTDAGGAWGAATTLSSILPANRSCVNMCHSDHPHTLTSPATATHQFNLVADPSSTATRAAGTSTSATRAATDFDPAGNTGMCTRCHQKPISVGGLTITDATFGVSAHDFTSSTTPAVTWSFALHDGSLFLRNCTKCHASSTEGNTPAVTGTTGLTAVHGQSNPDLLAGTKRPAGAPAGFVCYNCHGSAAATDGAQGNRSNKAVSQDGAKVSRHPFEADNVHDSVAELTNAVWGNTLGVTGRHSSCLDCHDPHEAKGGTNPVGGLTGNRAGPSLQGAWGVSLATFPAIWTAPTSANFTKVSSLTAGTDLEAVLCFKCHSSYYWGAGTPPNSLSANGTVTTPVETDTAMEFNPNNKSGHPVLAGLSAYTGSTAPKPLAATQMKAPWNTNLGTQTMACSDCHGTDAAAPAAQGPHGSASAFMLKGANKAWPNVVTTSFTTSFCANCHNNANLHTRDGAHGGANCYACHIVVPHGGKLSRLICDGDAAGAMPARYAYSNTKSNCRVQSFTKASSDANYQPSNCQANCTGTHSGAATETW